MKRFLYLLAMGLGVFTAAAYVVGKDWEEKAEIKQEELTLNQRLTYLKTKAGQADSDAQYELGVHYEDVEGDYLNAQKWYRAAASRGNHPAAKYKMGYLYMTGRGVENNMSAAMDWFRRAASQGDGRAQYFVGVALRDGWERKPDFDQAYMWLWLSSQQADYVRAEDPRYDPQKALDELAPRMSQFKRDRAIDKAKRWRPIVP